MNHPGLMLLLVSHWRPSWALMTESGLVALLYAGAARRVTGGWPWWRTAAFLSGLVSLLVALQSGIDEYDDRLLSVHMVQHLVLLELAPLMLVAGRPTLLALRAAPPGPRKTLARTLARVRTLTTPAACLAIFALVVVLTHLPAFYDATLRSAWLHALEHGLYVLAGLLLWWPLLDADPAPRVRLDGLGKLVYLIVAMMPMALVGAVLSRDPSLAYAAYARPARVLGISAVVNQQEAGALMWVAGGLVMVAAGLWLAVTTMVADERRQTAREQRLAISALSASTDDPSSAR